MPYYIRGGNKMTTKQLRKFIIKILIVIIFIISMERLYNSKDEFQVTAENESHYGIVEAKLRTKDKLEDFKYIYEVLEKNYPYFEVNKKQNGVDWLKNKGKYKRLIRNTKSDAEFYLAMERILGDLNDENINILNGEEFKKLYKTCYLAYSQSNSPESMAWYDIFTSPFVLYRYQFDGNLENVKLYDEDNLETKVLVKDNIAYMKIKEMVGFERLDKDYNKIKEFLKEVESYDKLIIDIRGSSGDENAYWENIVELLTDKSLNKEYYSFFKDGHRFQNDPYKVENLTTIKNLDEKTLEKFPKTIKEEFDFYKIYPISINPSDYISFKGKIYLLVDENVFSAAESFASFAKDTDFAVLIGETTGGNKTYEDVPITFLPKSKFAIKYSREMSMNSDGSINMETRTIPHIEVDPTPNEDFKEDKCIQTVIEDGIN